MDFSEYIGTITAINDLGNDECYEDINAKRVKEDGMIDEVKEAVYNPAGDHGKHNHTCESFIVLSGKWETE